MSDLELRLQICQGLASNDPAARREAAGTAYQRFGEQLRRAAVRRHHGSADEAVHELFIKLVESPREVTPAGLGSYFHTMLERVQRDLRKPVPQAIVDENPPASEFGGGAPELWLSEHLEDLRRAGVDEQDRKLVALLAAGLSFAEAGRRLRPGLADAGQWAQRRAEFLAKSLRLFWGPEKGGG